MNIKRVWFFLPAVLLPYLFLLALAIIFLSSDVSAFKFIMESVFHNNGFLLIALFLLLCILSGVISIIGFAFGVKRNWSALSLAKFSMIVKLIQIPAYIFIFVLGVAFILAIVTIPFSVVLFYFDCFVLLLTGIITTSAVANADTQNILPIKKSVWIIILQFVFCADVVASIIFYRMLKKRHKNMIKNDLI